MALSVEAAAALVARYLDGRALPPAVFEAVVLAAGTRQIDGDVPVLDEMLCCVIDRGAELGAPIESELAPSSNRPTSSPESAAPYPVNYLTRPTHSAGE